jgi:TPR repeat protein
MNTFKFFASSLLIAITFPTSQASYSMEEEKKDPPELHQRHYRREESESLMKIQLIQELSHAPSEESLACYTEAAEKGNVLAQYSLGGFYYNGHGVPKDYEKARERFEQAALQGYAPAQHNLGDLYYKGEGAEKDYVKAREWWEKAAAQGNAEAQYSLGNLYYNGLRISQNYVQAREWLEKSAMQGNALAQCCLGDMNRPPKSSFYDALREIVNKRISSI